MTYINSSLLQLEWETIIMIGIDIRTDLMRRQLPTNSRAKRNNEVRRDKAPVTI
jgi:hypothetical protein